MRSVNHGSFMQLLPKLLEYTKLRRGYHPVPASMPELFYIYSCINPVIRVNVLGPYGHGSLVEFDLRDWPKGVPGTKCSGHSYVRFRWEEGAGDLDSGVPHTYVACMHCGAKQPAWWRRSKNLVVYDRLEA